MNDTDKIEELLRRIKWLLYILTMSVVWIILFGVKAHAATIAYGTTPAVASEITEDLKGLPDTGYASVALTTVSPVRDADTKRMTN